MLLSQWPLLPIEKEKEGFKNVVQGSEEDEMLPGIYALTIHASLQATRSEYYRQQKPGFLEPEIHSKFVNIELMLFI